MEKQGGMEGRQVGERMARGRGGLGEGGWGNGFDGVLNERSSVKRGGFEDLRLGGWGVAGRIGYA